MKGGAKALERGLAAAGARRLVVKVGSAVLAGGGNGLDRPTIRRLVEQLTALRRAGREVLLVSSGAILAGRAALGLGPRPRTIALKQAAAAVGQSHLMRAYEEAFQPHGQRVAQILLTRDDLRHRERYLNARNTLLTLIDLGVVPIINENDTVAVEEIKFGDNDALSALVANLVTADLLIILTDTDGLFTADPRRDPRARLVREVALGTGEARRWAGASASEVGTGGMSSKVEAASLAGASGTPTIVANGLAEGTLARLLAGEELGTYFAPRPERLGSRKRWLAFATHPRGAIVVDPGAKAALLRAGKSLLPSGIVGAREAFGPGDVVSLVDGEGREFGRGLTNYAADEVERIKGLKTGQIERALGYKYTDEVVHRDNLVILAG
jgi:glutamate 5-kinase